MLDDPQKVGRLAVSSLVTKQIRRACQSIFTDVPFCFRNFQKSAVSGTEGHVAIIRAAPEIPEPGRPERFRGRHKPRGEK